MTAFIAKYPGIDILGKRKGEYMRMVMLGQWRGDSLKKVLQKRCIFLENLADNDKKPALIIFWQPDTYLTAQIHYNSLTNLCSLFDAALLFVKFPEVPVSPESIKAKFEISLN